MVDVKKELIFPTPLRIFNCGLQDLNELDMKQMIIYIKQSSNKKSMPHQTIDDLYQLSTFKKLYDIIMEQSLIFVQELQYSYDKLDMTSMWGNYLLPNGYHPPHTHSNSFLTGVFYLLSPDGPDGKSAASGITFFDPRPQASILTPSRIANQFNSNMLYYPSIKGTGYIFPSWVQHMVQATPVERISISWNILLRGEYGQPHTRQNAYI